MPVTSFPCACCGPACQPAAGCGACPLPATTNFVAHPTCCSSYNGIKQTGTAPGGQIGCHYTYSGCVAIIGGLCRCTPTFLGCNQVTPCCADKNAFQVFVMGSAAAVSYGSPPNQCFYDKVSTQAICNGAVWSTYQGPRP